MRDGFDAFEYAAYLRERWKFIASCCAIAGLLTAAISFLLPKKYTATASILIDAPAGNDPRAATAVSPIYLESLKTYERFADSDTLFVTAIDRFKLREEAGAVAADSLKRRVLKVVKPRDTKLLEISVTLPDPTKAQAVAQFLAEQTANLNRSLTRVSDEESAGDAQRQLDAARTRFDDVGNALQKEAAGQGVDSLRSEIDGLVDLKIRLRRELVESNLDSAEYGAQEKITQPGESPPGAGDESRRLRRALAGAGARALSLQTQIATIERNIAEKESLLASRKARMERLDAGLNVARSAYEIANTHLNEVRASAGIRGERLKIIDPGIVPQRPSSPNIPLNVLGALLAAAVASLLYVTIAFNYHSRSMAARARPVYR